MSPLTADDFPVFFNDLWGHAPYAWQKRLVDQLCAAGPEDPHAGWPAALDLPTGSGKTAAIDAAVFALAVHAQRPVAERAAPRRIVFCVNRRVVVAGAADRARTIATRLRTAEEADEGSVAARVAAALRSLTGRDPEEQSHPLDVLELRGGLFRDDRWTRSATAPTVLACTVDQLGSRLLFRGYGVSPGMRPVHAALLAHDSLVLLDEAHISRPFQQTLESVRSYAAGESRAPHAGKERLGVSPLVVVAMTATPAIRTEGRSILGLTEEDRTQLGQKLSAAKPTRLEACKPAQLSAKLTAAAAGFLHDDAGTPRKVGVIVNRVATAKAVHAALRKQAKKLGLAPDRIHLVIGAMRPIDRDRQMEQIERLLAEPVPGTDSKPAVVVATQCIEVGADYDFGALVAQAASLDAIRQRFGRLNRAGRHPSAPAALIHDGAKDDPVYGTAAHDTWGWLQERATGDEIDLGIDATEAHLRGISKSDREKLLAPGATLNAPVLLPAHLDLLAQTHPEGGLAPDLAVFLHGPQRDLATVSVCWRGDLHPDAPQVWADRVSLLPPVSTECMPVALGRFLAWTRGDRLEKDPSGDGPGEQVEERNPRNDDPTHERTWLVWRGDDTQAPDAKRLPRPGDVVVLSAHLRHGNEHPPGHDLGHLLPAEAGCAFGLDVAEPAHLTATDRFTVRLHPDLDGTDARRISLRTDLLNEDPEAAPAGEKLRKRFYALLPNDTPPSAAKCGVEVHVVKNPVGGGVLLSSRGRLGLSKEAPSGHELSAGSSRTQEQSLADHVADVRDALDASLAQLPLDLHAAALQAAAEHHDDGKLDPRFQAMLLGVGRSEAQLRLAAGLAWAKSGSGWLSPAERNRDRHRAGLPRGFRHEMRSLELALANPRLREDFSEDPQSLELIHHLIAAHHGHARPLAPVPGSAADGDLGDPKPPTIRGSTEHNAHRASSGVARRFAGGQQRFGWWGLAYLEAVLRLADMEASAFPKRVDAKASVQPAHEAAMPATPQRPTGRHTLSLPGLRAETPLGFFAALGLLRFLDRRGLLQESRLGWVQGGAGWTATLQCDASEEGALDEAPLLDSLLAALNDHPAAHPARDWAAVRDVDTKKSGKLAELRTLLQALAATPDAAWASAWGVEPLPDVTREDKRFSQLQVSRKDYHVKAVLNLLAGIEREHLSRTLLHAWDYADPMEGVSLHIDPTEDRRHAYQWNQPAGDPDRKSRGNMIGASRLAIEAYPLFPAVHLGTASQTLGFRGTSVRTARWTWPVWEDSLNLSEICVLLNLAELQQEQPAAESLAARGIRAAFRSRRILVGKTPNLTPAEGIA